MTETTPSKAQNALSLFMALVLSLSPIIGALSPRIFSPVMIISAILGLIAFRLIEKRWPALNSFFLISASGLVVLSGLSIFWAYSAEATIARSLDLLAHMIGAIAFLSVASEYKKNLYPHIAKVLPASFMIAGILLIIDLYGQSMIYGFLRGENQSIYGLNLSHLNRNVVSLILLSLPAFLIVWQQQKTKKYMILGGILLMIVAAILYKTDSQAAQFGLAIFLATFALVPSRLKNGWKILSIAIAVLILLTPYIAQYLYIYADSNFFNMSWFQKGYVSSRFEIWDFTARRALESPWIGHGIEATRAITDFDIPHKYHAEDSVLHPHNFAIQIWIEFGLLGAILTSIALSTMIKLSWQASYTKVKVALILAVLAIASTGHGMWQSWWIGLLVILAALITAISPQKIEKKVSVKE